MTVKLKDIKGLLVRKKSFTVNDHIKKGSTYINKIVWENRIIELQGERSLTLNREKVIGILKKLLFTPKKLDKKPTIEELQKLLDSPAGQSLGMLPDGEIACLRPSINMGEIADVLIAALPEILESVKE